MRRFIVTVLTMMTVLATVASASAQPQQITPGFQDTVNNYTIPMDPTPASCRPRNVGCSKHMNFHFTAHTDGTITIPFEMTNDDALHGFCARVRIDPHPGLEPVIFTAEVVGDLAAAVQAQAAIECAQILEGQFPPGDAPVTLARIFRGRVLHDPCERDRSALRATVLSRSS